MTSESETNPKGVLVIQILAMPADTNANGDIFGGWLVAHLDMGAGIAARRQAKCRVVTVAINGLTFIKPVAVGDVVACYADLQKVGHTSLTFKMEAWKIQAWTATDIQPMKVGEGLFTFVAIDDKGKPQPVNR